jgi:inositol 3-alpha-galactosyltransferase
MREPYFEATQSVIWRLLWSEYHSIYPIIVFVCPFIPEENRHVFRGQGALVKEIGMSF